MASAPITSVDAGGLSDSMLGKYHCRISIGPYTRPTPFKKSIWKPSTSIFLPLPDILHDDTSVKYSGVEMESVGDFINGNIGSGFAGIGARNVGSVASGLISAGAGAAVGAATELLTKGPSGKGNVDLGDILGGAVSQGAANAFPADKIQTAFEQINAASPNPNPSVAFQGPNLREFQLSWTFFPRSSTESDKIQNIIKVLKQASLPSNKITQSAAILNYPDIVQLNFFPWDENGKGDWYWSENSIIKMKKCVMNNVSVDYNPSNMPGFFAKTNKPVAIRISIGFSEIEYMLSSDWGSNRKGVDLLTAIADTVVNTVGAFNPLTTFSSNTATWTT
jgi:hypothetical protein